MSKKVREMSVEGKEVSLEGTWLKTARLIHEWYEDLEDPDTQAATLVRAKVGADLFTFLQRLPDIEPRYPHLRESEPSAVLRVSTYDNWFRNQINNKTRNLIVKAQKKGVVVKPAVFNDDFIRGMTTVFNETPVRQGMPFWHYGKDFETVKREFSRFLFREELAGAYLEGNLIGFIFLANAGRFAMLGQIISMMQHRDKAVNNALIAKAVEMCAERQIPHLIYAVWPRGPLKDFKRHNGFERMDIPRYYIPLTKKGELALKLGFHRSPIDRLPDQAFLLLREIRSKFYAWRRGRPEAA